jgi:hypothetical protein
LFGISIFYQRCKASNTIHISQTARRIWNHAFRDEEEDLIIASIKACFIASIKACFINLILLFIYLKFWIIMALKIVNIDNWSWQLVHSAVEPYIVAPMRRIHFEVISMYASLPRQTLQQKISTVIYRGGRTRSDPRNPSDPPGSESDSNLTRSNFLRKLNWSDPTRPDLRSNGL